MRAKVGQDVALHVFGMDNNFHDFHIHGHRWKDAAGAFVDTPSVGPNETITARFVEDNPGRWLYHCHVFSHQDAGMAGWYLVEVGGARCASQVHRRVAVIGRPRWRSPGRAGAVDYPPPANPERRDGQAQGPVQDAQRLQGQEVLLPDDPGGGQQGQAR